MKLLLNENLFVLRVANINSNEREWEEFTQSLFEIHLTQFSKEQLLTEGFLDKVKETFKKATDTSKKYLQYSFNQFKKNGEKPSEFVQDIGDAFQGIKVKNPKRRAAYRARHNCDNPGPRWKANYWSCRKW